MRMIVNQKAQLIGVHRSMAVLAGAPSLPVQHTLAARQSHGTAIMKMTAKWPELIGIIIIVLLCHHKNATSLNHGTATIRTTAKP